MNNAQPVIIRPQPGPQEKFLASPADIVIYGGSAGGGKTFGLLLDPMRHIHVPGFNGIVFRRTYPEITVAGGLWDESMEIYPHAGGQGVRGDLIWRWPASGARIDFRHLQHEANVDDYLGAQICYLAFDQAETFSERQWWYLFSRNRSTCGVAPYIRATANPPLEGDSHWLTKLIRPWLTADGYADWQQSGRIRWLVRTQAGEVLLYDRRAEALDRHPNMNPEDVRSITFIPATLKNNRILMHRDPGYMGRLKALPPLDRDRLLGDEERGGNWFVRAAAGKIFDRGWFEVVANPPAGGLWLRAFDFAGSLNEVATQAARDADYTDSVLMVKREGTYTIVDYTHDRLPAGEVHAFVRNVAVADRAIAGNAGGRYLIRWEQEGGSAGARDTAALQRELAGFDAKGRPATGSKLVKWRPFASAAMAGKVKIVAAPWTNNLLAALHGVPDLPHDDAADAGAIAYNELEPLTERKSEPQQNPWLGKGR